jgi:hypothetical protein
MDMGNEELEPARRHLPFSAGPERRRLRASIDVAYEQLKRLDGRDDFPQALKDSARKLLNLADRAANQRGDLDMGWRYLHEAERLFVASWNETEREAARLALAKEAEAKLDGWRKDTVLALLTKDGAAPFAVLGDRLVKALQIRDEHTDNVYFRNRLVRRQMGTILLSIVLLIIAFVWIISARTDKAAALRPAIAFVPVLAAMALGGMGACLSALIGFASTSTECKIPEHLASVWITVTRPFIGAVSGLVALLVIAPLAGEGPALWLAVAFAFGFSERLVIGALDKMAQTTGPGAGKP